MDFDTGAIREETRDEPRGTDSPGSGGGRGGYDLSDPVGSFIETVRSIVLEPVSFFQGMQRSGDYAAPLVFTLICAAIGGLISGLITLISNLVSGDVAAAVGGFFGNIFGTPIGAVIGLFIGAGVTHLFVMLFVRPRNSGFEATYRVLAYLSVVYLVSWLSVVPLLGILVLLALIAYFIVLEVIGIRAAHSTTTGRAAAVVLIPAAIFFIFFALIAILVGLAIFFGAQQGQF